MKTVVVGCAIPEGALISRALPAVDYADAFEAAVPETGPRDAVAFTRAMLGSRPRWIGFLMRIRDSVMGVFGAKTMPRTASVPEDLRPGGRIGFFEVFELGADELLLGADDRHLDFRFSTLYRHGPRGTRVVLTTTVRFHNGFGRFYFAIVKPFHKLVVRSMLRKALSSQKR